MWNLKNNNKETLDKEKMVEKQARNEKKPIPEWLDKKRREKPELGFGLSFYYNAFFDIGSERPPSEMVWNISWSSIQRYADHYEMEFDQAERLHFIIRKMDNAYIEFMSEKGKGRNDGKEQQPRQSRKTTKK